MISKGQLKELLHSPKILISPGVYDGFSARLVEKMGFETASISGAGVSESKIGGPDRGIMGFGENVEACRKLPVQRPATPGRCGHGLRQRAQRVVHRARLRGRRRRRGHDRRPGLAQALRAHGGQSSDPGQEMVQKVKAAVEAKRDPDFLIKARTDAAGPLGIEEAIRRLNMYAEAGADCLFADALLSAKDIERVARNVPPLTLSVNMGLGIRSRPTTPLLTPKQLEEMGVAQVSYPRLLTTAALKGMINAMKVFKDEVVDGNKVVDRPDLLASFDELNELMGFDALDELEERFAS